MTWWWRLVEVLRSGTLSRTAVDDQVRVEAVALCEADGETGKGDGEDYGRPGEHLTIDIGLSRSY
jgi:hypothetical protein